MIKLKSVHVKEVRGVRDLKLSFDEKNFSISGPNGSGKSGIVDAIEFALTGEISRLAGSGTKGLSVLSHGPHVDKKDFPDAASVELEVFIPSLGKSATITRKIKTPKKATVKPKDADVLAVLAEIADHPEITLSRREIIRFILTEPSKRSEEVQALLKLDEIGQTRKTLQSTQNRLVQKETAAQNAVGTATTALTQHLQVPELSKAELLAAVNKRRDVLDLKPLDDLKADTNVDEGLSKTVADGNFNKNAALDAIKTLSEQLPTLPTVVADDVAAIVADLAKLEADTGLFAALRRHPLLEQGLALVDGPNCPLCDTPWDEDDLRTHIEAQLAKSEEARKIREALLKSGGSIATAIATVRGAIRPAAKLAKDLEAPALAEPLDKWDASLEAFAKTLGSIDGIITSKQRLEDDWSELDDGVSVSLEKLKEDVEAKPDQSAAMDAHTFLKMAQERLDDRRSAQRKAASAKNAADAARKAYKVYCDTLENALEQLYKDIQDDFGLFYRELNGGDEDEFTAKLTPNEGALDLDVNFYDRGLYPPGAYHSEGHQDGMGVCLYLALMKRLLGKEFTFSVLDDVVMSVDADHRRQFCALLKTHFPDTQFIITTHDRVWAEQMRHAKLVTAKTSVAFHGWSIDTGPMVESIEEIWDEIDEALEKNKVERAAHALRLHLEYVSRLLADQLRAKPEFRGDGNYELGQLLPAVLKRQREHLAKALKAAHSWDQTEAHEAIAKRKELLGKRADASNVEQWAINPAIHYNEWQNFSKADFEPVVAAFRALLDQFLCETCQSWLHLTLKKGQPEALRCDCGSVNMNLLPK